MSDDLQLFNTLRLTAEFLHAQGCGEACAAVEACMDRLGRPSPLTWDLKDEHGTEYKIVLVDTTLGYAQIAKAEQVVTD